MRHSHTVLLILLLARVLLSPEAYAQQPDSLAEDPSEANSQEIRGVELEQNYPNPFDRETRIPFVLGENLFKDGRPVIVSVRIYNVLHQLVAVPTATSHPFAAGQPAVELRYDQPGRYIVLWDGRDLSGEAVSSGIYFCQVTANGARAVRKMIVAR